MTMLINSLKHMLWIYVFDEIGLCAHNVDNILRSIVDTIGRV